MVHAAEDSGSDSDAISYSLGMAGIFIIWMILFLSTHLEIIKTKNE